MNKNIRVQECFSDNLPTPPPTTTLRTPPNRDVPQLPSPPLISRPTRQRLPEPRNHEPEPGPLHPAIQQRPPPRSEHDPLLPLIHQLPPAAPTLTIPSTFEEPREDGGAPRTHVVAGDRLHDDGVAQGVAGVGVAHVDEACDGGGAEGGVGVKGGGVRAVVGDLVTDAHCGCSGCFWLVCVWLGVRGGLVLRGGVV